MTTTSQNRTRFLPMFLAAIVGTLSLASGPSHAATMSADLTAPLIDSKDIANYGTVTGTVKWFAENSAAGKPGRKSIGRPV